MASTAKKDGGAKPRSRTRFRIRPLLPPQRLGRYALIAKLGQGGMAEVYLALHEGAGGVRKLLVLKLPHHHMLEDPGFAEMFMDEARLATRLNHPNVVQTIEVGEADGLPYMTMEYLQGRSLDRIVRGRTPLPMQLGIQVIVEVLRGLQHAHDLADYNGTPLNVVHRDVSPSNVFVTYDGAVKLLDFGIAMGTLKSSETQTGQIKGKFAYIAPEQAQGGAVDRRADIWAVAVTLVETLVPNKSLFKGGSHIDTLRNVLSAPIDNLLADIDLPEKVLAIVRRGLQRTLSKRYGTAEEMARDLEAVLDEMPRMQQSLAVFMRDTFSEELAIHRQLLADIFAQLPDELPSEEEARPFTRRHSLSPKDDDDAATSVRDGKALDEEGATVASSHTPFPAPKGFRRNGLRLYAAVLIAAVAAVLAVTLLKEPEQVATGDDTSPPTDIATVSGAPEVVAVAPDAGVRPEPVPEIVVDAGTTPEPEEQPTTKQRTIRRPRPRPTTARTMDARPTMETQPTMETPRPVADTEYGFLTLWTEPWSEVRLDGQSLGTTPLARRRVPAGRHTLVLRNPEANVNTQIVIEIRPGETTARRLALQ